MSTHRGEVAESGAAAVVASCLGEGTARRLKLAMAAGLEFGRTWRVPRTSQIRVFLPTMQLLS